MVGACIVIFILALIYEGLKVFREHLLRKALTPNYHSEATISKYTHTSTDTMVIDPQSAKSNGYVYKLSPLPFVISLTMEKCVEVGSLTYYEKIKFLTNVFDYFLYSSCTDYR